MSRSDDREVRLGRIIRLVKEQHKISTNELAKLMDVSEMTIRRDLDILSKNGVIQRLHGYASDVTMNQDTHDIKSNRYDYRIASVQNLKAKEKIAKYASSLIRPNDWIFIDNGTTTALLPEFIPTTFEFTALCCSFTLLEKLREYPNLHLIMPGGYYNKEDQTFSSAQADAFIRTLRANKAFISASGVHQTLGMTCINSHSVPNKRAFIESSAERILLVDSSKFDVVTANHFGELDDIDMIITDNDIPNLWKRFLKRKHVETIIV